MSHGSRASITTAASFHYPLKAFNALAGLGLINAIRIVVSYADARLRPSAVEETFEQWVVNRFGRRLYETFFKTYTEKVWGIPCTEIRAEWAAQRIQGLSLYRALVSASVLHRRDDSIKTLLQTFKYPKLGPGQMWEAARDRIEALGGRMLMRHTATAIDVRGEAVCAVQCESDTGSIRLEADHVISTTDLRSLIRALRPQPPMAARAAAEQLRYRDFLVVALVLDRAPVFPDNWIYVHTRARVSVRGGAQGVPSRAPRKRPASFAVGTHCGGRWQFRWCDLGRCPRVRRAGHQDSRRPTGASARA